MEGARYAVLIASSQFPEEPALHPLHAPENDVDGLADVLRSPERGDFSEVVVLKNRPQHEIVRQIQRTLNLATKDDLIVLYYSGHGKLNRAGRLYLTATDTVLSELESSSVGVASLRDLVDASRAQRVVVILDSCFSGAVGDVFSKGVVDDQLQLTSTQGRGTYVMTASTGIQTAQEKEGARNSVFTKHLIAGIDSGEADLDRDGRITADELYDYVHRHVRSESHQEPTRWGMDVRGHLVLAKSGREPRKERAEELRTLLFKLAGENRINDELLTEALEIIRQPVAELDSVRRERDALLDELRQGDLNALDLVLRWHELGAGRGAGSREAAAAEEPAAATGRDETPSPVEEERAEQPRARRRRKPRTPSTPREESPPEPEKPRDAAPAAGPSARPFDPAVLEPSVVNKVIVKIVLVWVTGGLLLAGLSFLFLRL